MELPKIIDNKLPYDHEFISEVEHCCYAAMTLFKRSGLHHSERQAKQLFAFFSLWKYKNECLPTHANESEFYF